MSTPLKRLASVTLGKMIGGAVATGSTEVPYIRAAHVQPMGRMVDAERKLMSLSATERSDLTIRAGDVVVVEGGAGYGRSAFIPEDLPGWAFQNSIVRIRPINVHVDGRYLSYAIQSAQSSGAIAAICNTATIPHFTADKVASLRINALPPKAQRAIADFLDRETAQIDVLIAKQQQLIGTLRERFDAKVERVVWGRQPSRGAFAASPWAEAPPDWTRVRNKHLVYEVQERSPDGAGELLSVSHITGVTPRAFKNVTMFQAESTVGYRTVSTKDLVVNTMWAWMGALGISQYAGIVSPAYGVYRSKGSMPFNADFFNAFYRSRTYIDLMTAHSTGIWSSRLRLYPQDFLALPVLIPPQRTQDAIGEELAQTAEVAKSLTDRAERFIHLAHERRSALITAAVTGEITVPGGDM